MKNAILVLVLGMAGISFGEAQPYASIGAGWSLLPKSNLKNQAGTTLGKMEADAGPNIEGAVGVAFGAMPIRLEAALFYQHNNLSEFQPSDGSPTEPVDGDIQLGAVMGNLYIDFIDFNGIRPKTDYLSAACPYIFLGAGAAHASGNIDGDRRNDTVPAGQVGLGMGYYVSSNLVLDFRYKYFVSRYLEITSGGTKLEVSSHQLQFGVRYMF
jgi:opacity protein-like surface antigen